MRNIEYIKDSFDSALIAQGYGIRYKRAQQGYHTIGYSKVVCDEYIFYPVLFIEPDRLYPGTRYFGFTTGVELLFEKKKRFPLLDSDFKDSENL